MKRTLKQGMVNGIIHERSIALSSVQTTAQILTPYFAGYRAMAYDAAFDIANNGGQAEDVHQRFGPLNAAGIAQYLASHPIAPENADAKSPVNNPESID